MYDHLPNLQPGQRMIVRHHSNGDTEYICRRDDGIDVPGATPFSGLFPLVIMFFLALFIWWLLPEPSAVQDRAARDRNASNTEMALETPRRRP